MELDDFGVFWVHVLMLGGGPAAFQFFRQSCSQSEPGLCSTIVLRMFYSLYIDG